VLSDEHAPPSFVGAAVSLVGALITFAGGCFSGEHAPALFVGAPASFVGGPITLAGGCFPDEPAPMTFGKAPALLTHGVAVGAPRLTGRALTRAIGARCSFLVFAAARRMPGARPCAKT
jgi:hypothetical protein